MVKLKQTLAFFSIGLLLFAGLSSCSNGSDDSSSNDTSQEALSYDYLTKNRGFIGGSLIYNPSGTGSQLAAGTKVGIRLGKLEQKDSKLSDLSNLTADPAVDTADYWVDKSTPDNMGVAEAVPTAALFGGTLKEETMYEDIAYAAIYGYLSINSISENSVSLTFTKVRSDNTRTSIDFTINLGETIDLDEDGNPDLKYAKPAITRAGYANARWLTFICSEENCSTAMFYTFTKSAARAGYRATTQDAEMIEPGLYAVNTSNDFIFIQYGKDKPSSLDGMAYGDYVVSLPNDNPTIEITDVIAEADDNINVKDIEFNDNGVPTSESQSTADVEFYNFSYAITNPGETDTPTATSIDDYAPDSFKYKYFTWQFPDPENGPKYLLAEICEKESVKTALKAAVGDSFNEKGTTAQAIEYLNTALASEAVFTAVVNEFIKDTTDKQSVTNKYTSSAADDKITCVRQIFDEVYFESPEADIPSPDVGNIYPWMYVCAGSPDEDIDEEITVVPSGYYDDYLDADRSVHKSFDSFEKSRKKIRNEWSKFFGINLSAVLIRPADEQNKIAEKYINGKDISIILAAGIKGNLNDTKGHTDFTLGAAFYIDIDLNVSSLMKGLVDPAASEAIKKYLKYILSGREIGIKDKQVPGIPIPVVYSLAIQFGLTVDFGNANPRLCFIGLYGGEGTVNLDYGIKRKWCVFYPYLNASATGKTYYPTEFYFGLTGDTSNPYDIKLGPYIKLVPSIGIGCSAVSARASLPTQVGLLATFGVNQINKGNSFKEIAMTIDVGFNPYAEVKVWKFKLRKDFTNVPLLKHKVRFYPTPIQWMRQ